MGRKSILISSGKALSIPERGLHAYVPGGSQVLFLAGFIFGAGGMRAAFVADKGLCPPRGFLISFTSVQQTFI